MKYKERIEKATSVSEIRKIGKHLSERLVTENYSKKLERLVDKLVKKSRELKKKGGVRVSELEEQIKSKNSMKSIKNIDKKITNNREERIKENLLADKAEAEAKAKTKAESEAKTEVKINKRTEAFKKIFETKDDGDINTIMDALPNNNKDENCKSKK